MRVIVTGSRDWTDRQAIRNRLRELVTAHPNEEITIVQGGARGADSIAYQEAERMKLQSETHKANWERYGKAAGPIRNNHMAGLGADLCLAFRQEGSRGTQNMIETARKRGIPVEVIEG